MAKAEPEPPNLCSSWIVHDFALICTWRQRLLNKYLLNRTFRITTEFSRNRESTVNVVGTNYSRRGEPNVEGVDLISYRQRNLVTFLQGIFATFLGLSLYIFSFLLTADLLSGNGKYHFPLGDIRSIINAPRKSRKQPSSLMFIDSLSPSISQPSSLNNIGHN